MLHDNWLDIPWVIILHSFCFKPEMVSDKNARRNFFTTMFLCLFHKGITTEGENSYYLSKVLVFKQKLVLGKPSNCVSSWQSGFPSNTNLCVYLKIHTMRSIIFMINICIYNHPFKVFMNKEDEGVEDLMYGNVRETNWFRRFLMWAWIWWGVHEITLMLIDSRVFLHEGL